MIDTVIITLLQSRHKLNSRAVLAPDLGLPKTKTAADQQNFSKCTTVNNAKTKIYRIKDQVQAVRTTVTKLK